MAIARTKLVDNSKCRLFHLINRCVQRRFLLAQQCSHRRNWLQQPLRAYTQIFTINGNASGEDRAPDAKADGTAEIREPRTGQLIYHKLPIKDRNFEIKFLALGVQIFSFTFG
jgi:hypothetical protein